MMGMQTDTQMEPENLLHQGLLARSRRLRQFGGFIPPPACRARKHFLLTSPQALASTPESRAEALSRFVGNHEPELNMADPMNMMGGMKQQLMMIIPNMLQMTWVNWFFSGFVALKLPFSLTERLKAMVQRGVMLRTLDSAYVSSVSWFLILMVGLRGVHTAMLGSTEHVGGEERLVGMGMAGGQQPPSPFGNKIDYDGTYKQEKDEIEISTHDYLPLEAEYSLLGLKMPKGA